MEHIIKSLQVAVGDRWQDVFSIYIHVHRDMVTYSLNQNYKRTIYEGESFADFCKAVKGVHPRNEILYRKFSL